MDIHIINMTPPEEDDGPTLRQTGGPEDPGLQERFSEWVSAFRTLRKRYPSRDEIVNWVCQQGVKDGKANEPDSPPCPHCGQPMTDRDMGNKDEFHCKPCQIALAPLADMCLEDGAMLVWSITDRHYPELPHFSETAQWLEKVNADYPGPRLKQPSFMNDTEEV